MTDVASEHPEADVFSGFRLAWTLVERGKLCAFCHIILSFLPPLLPLVIYLLSAGQSFRKKLNLRAIRASAIHAPRGAGIESKHFCL